MPRPALANVSTASLQAELQRRAAELSALIAQRETLDKDIAELQAIAGAVTAAPVVKVVRKYRRRKAKAVEVAVTPAAKKGERAKYARTASDFVICLLAHGKVLTSAELAEAWSKAGRKGKVDNTLTHLVKIGCLKREKVDGTRGSTYVIPGYKASKAKAVAAKPVAKKTFTCPTCKAVFDSGPKLGGHYKAEPTHRQK